MKPEPGSLAHWLAYQQRTHSRAVDLGLARVREVAAQLGLLRPTCRVVTVGGTNGKGSTASCIAALLGAGAARVGLFTSPHLIRYNERIQIDGSPVDDPILVSAFERIEAARGAVTLTYFEYNTLAALQIFRDASVDAMVLEVGLGGRLDSINIIDADVAVLCSVGLDHRDWLGNTLEEIGREKAGIFRRRRPAVLGSADMPMSVWQAARELDVQLWQPGRDFRYEVGRDGRWRYDSPAVNYADLPPPGLAGAVQYGNSATAIAAVQALAGSDLASETSTRRVTLPVLNRERIVRALGAVHLPGRFQIIPGDVEWILDVAHNEPAAAVLAAALRARGPVRRTIAVAGMLEDKDAAAIAARLDPLIDEWILCGIDAARGLPADALRDRLGALRGETTLAPDVAGGAALARARARSGDRIVVFGSFYVVGPVLSWLGLY